MHEGQSAYASRNLTTELPAPVGHSDRSIEAGAVVGPV